MAEDLVHGAGSMHQRGSGCEDGRTWRLRASMGAGFLKDARRSSKSLPVLGGDLRDSRHRPLSGALALKVFYLTARSLGGLL